MPRWHEATAKWVQDGRLAILGVIQEHHADRCRLFAQWKGLDFPILHDPINLMGARGVPIVVAIDEYGIVRSTRPKAETLEKDFLDKRFERPETGADRMTRPKPPDVEALRRRAEKANSTGAWRALGDALALWHSTERIDEAVEAYSRAVKTDPGDGPGLFRLGVCYRMRYESDRRKPGDFQKAADYWGRALETNPNQYIWRRRIQQYGPRLDKPYPFYDWVEQASSEIKARGAEPVALIVPPTGSELAQPTKRFSVAPEKAASPDPKGRIIRDKKGFVGIETAIVPAAVAPGGSARVHVVFRCNDALKAHWNNDAEPLRLWLDPPEGWKVSRRLLEAPQPKVSQSDEVRRLDFDIQAPGNAGQGTARLPAYVLYYVCEDVTGACWMLRQDIEIRVPVRP